MLPSKHVVSEGGDSGGAQAANGGGARRNQTRPGSSLSKFGLKDGRSNEATQHEAKVTRVRGEGNRVSNND